MTDKKFTDEEIIKALECCKNCCCKQCDEQPDFQEAIDLINRQKTDIEKLNIQLQELWKTASLYKAESEMWDNYNKNLLTANTALSNEILEAKAEAYKEFAERLKERKTQSTMDKRICTNEMIDNLLKEMVGEE